MQMFLYRFMSIQGIIGSAHIFLMKLIFHQSNNPPDACNIYYLKLKINAQWFPFSNKKPKASTELNELANLCSYGIINITAQKFFKENCLYPLEFLLPDIINNTHKAHKDC